MAAVFRLCILTLIVFAVGLGVYDYMKNYENNGCEMTYMYEMPQYLKIDLGKDIAAKYPRYKLYIYGEGSYAENVRKMKLTGIPVLFIPGNAGSHAQVRSLGSVALRKAKDMKANFHFNFFSISFDEDFSALYGNLLWDEVRFTHECIKKILTLYKGATSPPKSVVLVGHSMGGLVAMAQCTLPGFDPSTVQTIVTQATPHQAPVIAFDPNLRDFYRTVHEYWSTEENKTLADVTVFSSGGGHRDVLVRGGLTSLRGIVRSDRSLSTNTMSVSRAWVSTDHLCHVWCKQIVLATMRFLFDIVDPSTKQIAVSPSYRWRAYHHHFIRNPGARKFKGVFDEVIALDPKVKWEIRKNPSWKFSRDSLKQTRYSVSEVPLGQSGLAYVAISSIVQENWIGVCALKDPTDERCKQVQNLAPLVEMLPPMYSDRKVIHVDAEELKQTTHVVAILPKTKDKIEVTSEMYSIQERHLTYNVTGLIDFFRSFPSSVMQMDRVINTTAPNAVFYNISLMGLEIPLQAFVARLAVKECSEKGSSSFSGPVMQLYIPWSHEHTYTSLRPGENGNLSLKLQTAQPPGFPIPAQLHLYLQPTCTYHLDIAISWKELFGQFIRFYGVLLPAFLAIQVLMSLSWQMKSVDEQGVVPTFEASHTRWAQPWRVVPVALLLKFLITFPEEDNVAAKLGLPPNDGLSLQRKNVWYAALPVMLYLSSYSFMALYGPFVHGILSVGGAILSKICGRCFSGSPFTVTVGQGGQYLLYMAALLSSAFACGTLGILIVYAVFVFKALALYASAQRAPESDYRWNKFNLQVSLVFLLMILVALNAPALLVWSKTLPISPTLPDDPSRTSGLLVAIAALLMTRLNVRSSEVFGVVGALLYISCVIMVFFTMESTYRISYFLTTALLFIAVPMSFTSWMGDAPRAEDAKSPRRHIKVTAEETPEEVIQPSDASRDASAPSEGSRVRKRAEVNS